MVADADAEKLLGSVIKRGVEGGCLRAIRWVIRRDPMRDSSVCQSPLRALAGVRPSESRVMIIFDHHGSGREATPARELEGEVIGQLRRAGFPESDVECIVLEPELEAVLIPVWDRVAELLAARRSAAPPTREQVLSKAAVQRGEEPWTAQLSRQPKEHFDAMLRLLRLRHEPSVFADVGSQVSLRSFKTGYAGGRLAARLTSWFGA